MNVTFLNAAGTTLFTRSDMERGHWTVQEYTVTAEFPFDPDKVITRGMRIAFTYEGEFQLFEVRQVTNREPDHYQSVTAEHIAVAELQDEHIDRTEITRNTAAEALTTALSGTTWSVGTGGTVARQSADFARGSVWQAVTVIQQNWNVYIVPRIAVSGSGAVTGKYLDIVSADGTWNGMRLSISKNLLDPAVTYNDEDVLTALYGYGGMVEVPTIGGEDETVELTFTDTGWTGEGHPTKPEGQAYLEWPEKTAIYGRNGRPRFGYYQNAAVKDALTLLRLTWEALQRTAEPKIRVSGTVADLKRLGYTDEPLRLHDRALVEIKETGEKIYKQIIMLDIDLLDPSNNRVEIGDYISNLVYITRETNERASGGGGGGGRGQTPAQAEEYNTYAEFYKTHEKVGMVVGTVNGGYYIKAGEIALAINETGEPGSYESTAYVSADHINISATSTAFTLAGALEHDSQGRLVIKDAGGLYVERTSGGTTVTVGVWDRGNLTGGVMVSQINGQSAVKISGDVLDINGSSITISADRIDINGIVSALAAITINVAGIFVSGVAQIQSGGTLVVGGGFSVGGASVSWKSKSVVTAVTLNGSHTFYDISGTARSGSLVTDVTTETINYLGS